MILDRLYLHNYKRFKDGEINFKDGITGIVGNNGVGKSSIVDGVFFALFGVSSGIASDFIVSSFAKNGEKCEVGLHFRVGPEAYYISRTFRKGKTVQHDATLTGNEGVRASGVSQVEAEVRRILGMGPADFRNTVYAAQKDLLTLLDLTPGKRKDWFLRALGIDYLNTGSQRILKEQADAKEQAAQLLQGELTALSRQDPAELEQVRLSITGLKDKIIALQAEEKQQQEKRAAVSAEKQEYDLKTVRQGKLVDQETTLRNDITELTLRTEALTGRAASLNVDEQDLQQLEQAVSEIPKAREEIEAYRAKKASFDRLAIEQKSAVREEGNLADRRNKITKQLETLTVSEKELAELYSKVRTALDIPEDEADVDNAILTFSQGVIERTANINARARGNDTEQGKIKQNRDTLRKTGPEGACPICLQRLGDHYADVEKEYEARLTEAIAEYDKINKELEKTLKDSKRVPALKPTLDQIKKIRIALGYRENLECEKAELSTNLHTTGQKLNALTKEFDALAYKEEDHLACKQRLVELECAQNRYTELTKRSAQQAGIRAQIAELNSQITSKTAALTELKAAIDANPIDLSAGIWLTHEVEKLDIALKSITQDLILSLERERAATQKIAELETAAQRIAELQSTAAALREEIEILKLTRTAIADYVVYIMQVVRARIETEVSSIISEITGGKYDQVLLDEDFNLLVRENDKEYTVDRFSGGEQDDIAVALRIALSRYLAELHNVHESTLLIFDEIFGSQDEERRANLLTALRSQESRFPQIILISHIAEIQGEFSHALIVQGNGPVSTVRAGA